MPPVQDETIADLPAAATVRAALDQALDAWWRQGTLPPLALVRDALLLLEAGATFDDAERSLLLRSCVAQRKGMLTALRYQDDPERTARILADALLQREDALTPQEMAQLRGQDTSSDRWYPPLLTALQEEAGSLDPERAAAAVALLEQLSAVDGQPLAAPVTVDDSPFLRRSWLRALLVLMVAGGLVALLLWQQQQARLQGLIMIPAGAYPPGAGESAEALPAFAIDRTEVTVAAYRRCYDQGACVWPPSNASARRSDYLIDPAFEQYPVVNVDWADADRYCTWAGRRLPTAAEWEVAAGYAPATGRHYRYPWGDQFLVQAANSALSGIGDTQAVRSYQPAGDSPLGVADMAGNVAEWTATAAEGDSGAGAETDEGGAEPHFIVKGGSYQDDASALAVAAGRPLPASTRAPWLGLRCAVTLAP